jgi:hypothetical protein
MDLWEGGYRVPEVKTGVGLFQGKRERRVLLVRTIPSFLGRSGRLTYSAPRKSVGIDIPIVATTVE